MAAMEAGTTYYTKEHEWLEYTDGVITMGITDHAQESLGDLVYVGDFPKLGTKVATGDVIAVVESVKATSDVFSPVSGVIEEVNNEVEDNPEVINQSAEDDGWLVRQRVGSKIPDAEEMFDAEGYATFCAEEG